jgi:hypothetical protein
MFNYLSQDRQVNSDSIVYVLKCVKADLTAYNSFQWNSEGPVEAPDFDSTPECGKGLHGWLWGEGDVSACSWWNDLDSKWLVLAVWKDDLIELDSKVKFPRCWVVFSGDRISAPRKIIELGAQGAVLFANRLGGDNSTLTGGDRSTLTGGNGSTLNGGDDSTLNGGYGSTLTGGYWSTLNGGDRSTLNGGDWSTLNGGDRSTLNGGDGSTLTGGYRSTLNGGNGSKLNGGDDSTLNGGDRSTLNGGYGSTLTGGNGSKLKGGDGSTLTGGYRSTLNGGNGSKLNGGDGSTLTGGYGSRLTFKVWDGNRYRLHTAYVGENGIKSGVPYQFIDGKFVEKN